MDAETVFNRFPKNRPALDEAYKRVYAQAYKSNREGATLASSLSQRMEGWLHRRVAADLKRRGQPLATLEIGAGTLNQLRYEEDLGPYDVVEPLKWLYQDSAMSGRVRDFFSDIDQVPLSRRYDRITSIAAFEHVTDLPEMLRYCAILLAPGGELRVSIPSEGTWLWTLGWRMTTGLEFWLRHRLDYGVLMRHEHVNSAAEIEILLRHFFAEVDRSYFGLGKALSLYQFFACRKPRRIGVTHGS